MRKLACIIADYRCVKNKNGTCDLYPFLIFLKVGQPSPMIQSQFELLSGGLMELKLLRRCNAHTCYGHCVCAPHGEVCLHSDSSCIQYGDSKLFIWFHMGLGTRKTVFGSMQTTKAQTRLHSHAVWSAPLLFAY